MDQRIIIRVFYSAPVFVQIDHEVWFKPEELQ